MSLIYNGTSLDNGAIKYNGTDLTKIVYGTTVVWEKGITELLKDFTYINNGNGTYTLTGWKGTYNGVASTEIHIPNDSRIIL